MRGLVLCIGAAKAGTTWLYEQLSTSRAFHFTPEKEINFFFSRYGEFDRLSNATRFTKMKNFFNTAANNFKSDLPEPEFARRFQFFQRNLDWYEYYCRGPVTDSWYRGLFREAGTNQYGCDFSPSTSKIPLEGINAVRESHENVKIIYVMRNPLERLWSHLKFHAMWMGKYDEVMKYSASEKVGFVRRFDLLSDGLYGGHLERFLQLFDESDVLLLNFEDITNDPEAVLRQVGTFLDVPPPPGTADLRKKVNVSSDAPLEVDLFKPFHKTILGDLEKLQKLGFAPAEAWAQTITRR
jgi:hypothetical protein